MTSGYNIDKSKKNNRSTGALAEELAIEYLRLLGYKILAHNYHCKIGEIDIIAKDEECFVFCEVKYRKDKSTGSPIEAVTPSKQKKISRVAEYYLTYELRTLDVSCRFDVLGVEDEQVSHIKNAFYL